MNGGGLSPMSTRDGHLPGGGEQEPRKYLQWEPPAPFSPRKPTTSLGAIERSRDRRRSATHKTG